MSRTGIPPTIAPIRCGLLVVHGTDVESRGGEAAVSGERGAQVAGTDQCHPPGALQTESTS
jgi:hypothetical protein